MDLDLHYRDFVVQHPDPDLARDPLLTNRRMLNVMDKAMFGTLIPDTVGPTVDTVGPVDLQHVVGLSICPATNLSSSLPPADLATSLCEHSVVPTLGLGRRAYWDEVHPILKKWQSVNDARCPECARSICVNMSCHIRLAHTICQCFWRCLSLTNEKRPARPCGWTWR